jgi:hypothetical protein
MARSSVNLDTIEILVQSLSDQLKVPHHKNHYRIWPLSESKRMTLMPLRPVLSLSPKNLEQEFHDRCKELLLIGRRLLSA